MRSLRLPGRCLPQASPVILILRLLYGIRLSWLLPCCRRRQSIRLLLLLPSATAAAACSLATSLLLLVQLAVPEPRPAGGLQAGELRIAAPGCQGSGIGQQLCRQPPRRLQAPVRRGAGAGGSGVACVYVGGTSKQAG